MSSSSQLIVLSSSHKAEDSVIQANNLNCQRTVDNIDRTLKEIIKSFECLLFRSLFRHLALLRAL